MSHPQPESDLHIDVLPPGAFALHRAPLLAVRHAAYVTAGLADPAAPPSSTEDAYDPGAWFVVARVGGELIGAVRVHLHPDGGPWEFERLFAFPPDFPPRSTMAEVSKVCVRPDVVSASVSWRMFLRCAELVTELGRTEVLGCCAERMFPIYRRAGCRATSVRFLHPRTQAPSLAFLGDTQAVLKKKARSREVLHA